MPGGLMERYIGCGHSHPSFLDKSEQSRSGSAWRWSGTPHYTAGAANNSGVMVTAWRPRLLKGPSSKVLACRMCESCCGSLVRPACLAIKKGSIRCRSYGKHERREYETLALVSVLCAAKYEATSPRNLRLPTA